MQLELDGGEWEWEWFDSAKLAGSLLSSSFHFNFVVPATAGWVGGNLTHLDELFFPSFAVMV
jgi:hypothetical protein